MITTLDSSMKPTRLTKFNYMCVQTLETRTQPEICTFIFFLIHLSNIVYKTTYRQNHSGRQAPSFPIRHHRFTSLSSTGMAFYNCKKTIISDTI